MADLYLVRHGQASFGAADYDNLSPLGARQSTLLGQWLRTCGIVPDAVASGAMARQRDTAALCLKETGGPREETWLRLDGLGEYDHDSVVARYRPDYADPAVLHADLARTSDPRRAFHAMYVKAIARWTGGAHDADYAEPWPAFKARALGALEALTAPHKRCVVAFTSGGPITAIVQHLLDLPDARAFEMNWPIVNTSITRLRFSAGSGAVSLSTYNSHPHLDQADEPGLVTYR